MLAQVLVEGILTEFEVRLAILDDAHAICDLARSRVGVWQRMTPGGQVENVTYESLSIYERWLHGGPWMSVETGALQLSCLRLGGGIPVVVLADDGSIRGYAELYTGTEPSPYGRHMHLGHFTINTEPDARDALFAWIVEHARQNRCERLTVNCAVNDEAVIDYYTAQGMTAIDDMQRLVIAAKAGQVFYKAVEHLDDSAEQINGWYMWIGRLGSARYQWEALWPRTWDVIPQIQQRKTHRLNFNAAGNDAYVLVRQQLFRPRLADVFCWTPKPPTGQLITAIRDWAQREGYRKLVMPTTTNAVKTLGLDAEPDGYRENIYALTL
jgi:hypothetical protein